MITQMTVKAKVFFGILVLAAAGLVAAEWSYSEGENRVELAPQAGPPAARGLDTISTPRECDLQRGIDNLCTFV